MVDAFPIKYAVDVSEMREIELATKSSGRRPDLPFEQYQRYRIVADALERLRESSRPLRVLAACDADSALPELLPEGDDIEMLDPDEESATRLPFEDGTFDIAVSVDVLGRLKSEGREKHLSELRRIARRGVLLSTPFDSGAVRGAERTANEFHRAVQGADNARLREHAEHGLPILEDIRAFFENLGDGVSVFPNGFLPHWLAMTCLSFHGPRPGGAPGSVHDLVGTFYNEYIYDLDNTEPAYRHLLVCVKRPAEANLDGLASLARDPERTAASCALFGTLSAMLPVTTDLRRLEARFEGEIVEYRRRLLEKEGELARKEAQVHDLSGRLAEVMSLQEENASLRHQKRHVENQLRAITGSRTWRMLAVPLAIRRRLLRLLGR